MIMQIDDTYSEGEHTWWVSDLWAAAATLPAAEVLLVDIEADKLLESHSWACSGSWTKALTVKEVLDHARRVRDADLTFPIILTPEGRIADGTHRIVKALLMGNPRILAVKLIAMPCPRSLRPVTQEEFDEVAASRAGLSGYGDMDDARQISDILLRRLGVRLSVAEAIDYWRWRSDQWDAAWLVIHSEDEVVSFFRGVRGLRLER